MPRGPHRDDPTPALLKFRYDLQQKLAEGPVLDTWRGFDRVREEAVVVKVLRPRFAEDEKLARKWMQQMHRLRQQTLPNSPQVQEAGRDGAWFYMVRDLVAGPSLERWMSRPRTAEESLTVGIELLRAIADWHARGMIHGQLHPGNIILRRNGPVFCDHEVTPTLLNCFGVWATRRKHLVYLAPEVREQYTARPASDVYSIGVVLWELLTGRRLVPDQRDVPAPSAVQTDLPAEVDVVVEGMLKPDPNDRYPASQAAEALASLRDRAEPEVESSPRERRRQRVRDRRDTARKPLPWPITVILVFYRFVFILMFTLLVSVTTIAGMAYGSYRYIVTSRPAEVIVPDVVGMKTDEAKALFEDNLGLDFTVTLKQASPAIAAGHVISIKPEPGHRVREGRHVEAVVSTGAELVTVPRLIGLGYEEVETTLGRLGLVIGYRQQVNHPQVPPMGVVAQNPGAGRKIAAGSKVDLKISVGPPGDGKPAETPAPANETAEEAAETPRAKRVGRVKITVPSQPSLTWVKIVVRDDENPDGATVYNQLHYAGDVVIRNVEGRGETVIEVYLGGNRVETKVL